MGIDLGEKQGIEKRAVRVAGAPRHAEMIAKTVERPPHARQLAARQLQSVDNEKKWAKAAQRQFGVQEAEIERCVVGYKRRAGHERYELPCTPAAAEAGQG
jgi:hypothetical protein